MKKAIIAFIAALSLCIFPTAFSFAQADTAVYYSGVVKIDSAKQAILFTRAQLWVNDHFHSGKDATQIADKEAGMITGTGYMTVTHKLMRKNYEANVYFTWKILIKDGRYKYVFENLDHKGITGGYDAFGPVTSATRCPIKGAFVSQATLDSNWKDFKDNLEIKVLGLIRSLQAGMVVTDNF